MAGIVGLLASGPFDSHDEARPAGDDRAFMWRSLVLTSSGQPTRSHGCGFLRAVEHHWQASVRSREQVRDLDPTPPGSL